MPPLKNKSVRAANNVHLQRLERLSTFVNSIDSVVASSHLLGLFPVVAVFKVVINSLKNASSNVENAFDLAERLSNLYYTVYSQCRTVYSKEMQNYVKEFCLTAEDIKESITAITAQPSLIRGMWRNDAQIIKDCNKRLDVAMELFKLQGELMTYNETISIKRKVDALSKNFDTLKYSEVNNARISSQRLAYSRTDTLYGEPGNESIIEEALLMATGNIAPFTPICGVFDYDYIAYDSCVRRTEDVVVGGQPGRKSDTNFRLLADTTGTGVKDLVEFRNSGVWIATSDGYGSFRAWKLVVKDFGHDQGWHILCHPRFMIDLTGDGRADILGFGNHGIIISLNNGDGTFAASRFALNQLGYNENHGGWNPQYNPRFLFDSNGNGLPDIYGFGYSGVEVAVNNINVDKTFKGAKTVVNSFGIGNGWLTDRHPRFVVDLNGNGTGDIIGFGNQGVTVSLNNGKGKFSTPRLVLRDYGYNAGNWRVGKHPRFVADMNGDGTADIVGFGDAGVILAINKGDGTFHDPELVVPEFGYDQGWRVGKHPRFVADLTGNKYGDIVGIKDDGVYVCINRGGGNFGPVRKVT